MVRGKQLTSQEESSVATSATGPTALRALGGRRRRRRDLQLDPCEQHGDAVVSAETRRGHLDGRHRHHRRGTGVARQGRVRTGAVVENLESLKKQNFVFRPKKCLNPEKRRGKSCS